MNIDIGDPLKRRQRPEQPRFDIRGHHMRRQTADTKSGNHQAPHFLQARRRGDDAPAEALLIAKDGQRREHAANLVTGEADEVLPLQVALGNVFFAV
ncbi:hypothetical protein D3C73_1532490 [compost metagenome]